MCTILRAQDLWLLLVHLVVEVSVWVDLAFVELGLERVVLRPLLHNLFLYQLLSLVVNLV